MKAKLLLLASLSLTLSLVGCGDDRYTASEEHCKPEHVRSLPEGGKRDALVEACMKR
ncbi:entry exclusion lipoprotein TrbK [Xanthomonas euvesicatoria]|uniref:entry exclusion lipoprotein TrbK n=1 Tax=Xanthomonas euvesicatoria TaxID=456327 RepID=UPI001C45EBFA|nr:entry exclusion lipoprotein TrbK [Xanthomonas euvesicatoria]MBV6831290.1 entry exclusion lipoprotein TrbK [Xanthomonas campestris pv. viegasii]